MRPRSLRCERLFTPAVRQIYERTFALVAWLRSYCASSNQTSLSSRSCQSLSVKHEVSSDQSLFESVEVKRCRVVYNIKYWKISIYLKTSLGERDNRYYNVHQKRCDCIWSAKPKRRLWRNSRPSASNYLGIFQRPKRCISVSSDWIRKKFNVWRLWSCSIRLLLFGKWWKRTC